MAAPSMAPFGIRVIARTLIALVCLLAAAALLWVAVDLVRIRLVDEESVQAAWEGFAASQTEPPAHAPLEARPPRPPTAPPVVWVLGASSVVLPEGETFAVALQRLLHARRPDLTVENLGRSGVESGALRRIFDEALARAPHRPDLLVVYAGHNDFNVAYHGSVARQYDLFEPLLGLLSVLSERGRRHGYHYFLRFRMPPLLERLQALGLVRLRPPGLATVDREIRARFRTHLDGILAAARDSDVPVLLVTPVGNLLARPYGRREETTVLYGFGRALAGTEVGLRLLEGARESEFLTYDIRARSALVEELRARTGDGLYVVELDRWLEKRGLRLSPRLFADYLHFTPWGHEQVAACLSEFLYARRELVSKLGLDGEGTEATGSR